MWLTSVTSACERLEWDQAALMVLGDDIVESTGDAMRSLQAVAPKTRVLVLAGDSIKN
ncbi:MAG TPA: hypothetical protein VL357_10155 [Rariglobus sp.]|nr:hypothetical protein [Rariglobus sp.]